jgi:hypothetical protein
MVSYTAQLEISRAFWPLLLALTWIKLSVSRRRHQVDVGEVDDDPRRDNLPLRYVAAIAAQADTLFAEGRFEP